MTFLILPINNYRDKMEETMNEIEELIDSLTIHAGIGGVVAKTVVDKKRSAMLAKYSQQTARITILELETKVATNTILDLRAQLVALLAKFEAEHVKEQALVSEILVLQDEQAIIEKAWQDERTGRPLLAKATTKINDLEDELASLKSRCEVLEGAWTTRNGIAEKLEAENAMLNTETYCAYCGAVFPLDDNAAILVGDHIRTCAKHPMRQVEFELSSLKSLVTQYEGEDERMTAEIKEAKTDNKSLREANSNLEILVSAYLDKIVYRDTENLELKAELATWRKETKWGGAK